MNVGNVAFLKQKSISLLRNKVCYTPKEEKSVLQELLYGMNSMNKIAWKIIPKKSIGQAFT